MVEGMSAVVGGGVCEMCMWLVRSGVTSEEVRGEG